MLSLAEIIIERIKDAHEVRRAKKGAEAQGEESSQDGKRVQIMVAQIERRENYRLKEQIACLESLETLSLSSEESFKEFMSVSMAIFRTHCPSFQQTTSLNITELPNMKVHRLYREFLLKYANTFHFAHICSYLRRQICELNAVIYLGWLGQWSRGLLSEAIKKWGSSSESLRLRTELSKIIRDRLGQEKSKESTELFLHSRQNFYSYFLSELEEHYRKLDILDLDLNYLRSIKRVGRKEELIGKNVNESIAFIISKNNMRSAQQIRKFSEEYDNYCQMRSRKKMRISSDPQRSNKIPRMVMIKTLTSTKKIIRQENIENNDLLRGVKKSKKSKILLGEACQRIEFPLIQTVVNSKCVLSSPKTKKSLRKFIKTEAEEQKDPIFVVKNQIKVRSFFKRPPIASITPQSSSQKAIFQFNSIQSEFQSRRHSIIKKIQQRGIDLTTKGSKVTLPASSCFDDHALIRIKEERMFLSQKSK